jgi:hypothetical protein
MKEVSAEKADLLVTIMSDPYHADSTMDIQSDPLLTEFASDILAARGCIAYGMLFHGLYPRFQVDYGLHHAPHKKMAVPFAASDTPKSRAEYSHPDMAIIYTCLSYYNKGLTLAQFKGSSDLPSMPGSGESREDLCRMDRGRAARRLS